MPSRTSRQRPARWIALGLTVIGLAACKPGAPTEARSASVSPPDVINVFYTCDTRGHISPCNCSAGIAGGLARRKTFIDENKRGDSLIVDAGDMTGGTRPWELLELEYILRGYETIGYHAANIGRREAGLPAATLRTLREQHSFLVSANVADSGGALLFPPYRVVTLPSGYRATVLGILDDTLQADEIGEGVRILPPEEALTKAMPEATRASDFIVLLAFANEQAMKALAERFFEIDVIVGGDVEQPSGDAQTVNKSAVVYVTDKGKSVGHLALRYVGGQYVPEANAVTMLLDHVRDDPDMASLVAEFTQKQVDNNYPVRKDDEEGLTSISR